MLRGSLEVQSFNSSFLACCFEIQRVGRPCNGRCEELTVKARWRPVV
jgi:hypothetical protein